MEDGQVQPDPVQRTAFKTMGYTIVSEQSHTVVGYRTMKGVGIPIDLGRFVVGGHVWVLLFYPDGKRSSSEEPMANGPAGDAGEYAALYVALIDEEPNAQGIVSTPEGKVVLTFHRFTLVDQTGQGRDLTMGSTRDSGPVKVSCPRQGPNAPNCHGFPKFVTRSLLEDPTKGYLVNDTLLIHYTIELVVPRGAALVRGGSSSRGVAELARVPPPGLGADLAGLLQRGEGTDVTLVVEGEEFKAHKFLLQARSKFFHSLLNSSMREGLEGRVVVQGIKAPVFKALLHFVYVDNLPEGMEDGNFETEMAQHLLAAADQMQLERLRRICERRLCETVEVDSVADTLALADANHSEELKRVCLDFVGRNLAAVMKSEGYSHMVAASPRLQADILATMAAQAGAPPGDGGSGAHLGAHKRSTELSLIDFPMDMDDVRRVRPRQE